MAVSPPRPKAATPGYELPSPAHLLVDSTKLKLCGASEWLLEMHGAHSRRSWRRLHIGVDTDAGRIIAAELTDSDVDDDSQLGSLFDRRVRWPRSSPKVRMTRTVSTARSPGALPTLR